MHREEKLWEGKIMNHDTVIELDEVTIEDCIDLLEKKNTYTIINDGKIINFVKG